MYVSYMLCRIFCCIGYPNVFNIQQCLRSFEMFDRNAAVQLIGLGLQLHMWRKILEFPISMSYESSLSCFDLHLLIAEHPTTQIQLTEHHAFHVYF
jgi:hypothetical protein